MHVMRVRLLIVVVVAVLLAGAFFAAHRLEQVEPVNSPDEPKPAAPVAVVAPTPSIVVDEEAEMVRERERAARLSEVRPEDESEDVPALTASRSTALSNACSNAVDTCAEKFQPWFSTEASMALTLEANGSGSRAVASRFTGDPRSSGPTKFYDCVRDTMQTAEFDDLPLNGRQRFVSCPLHLSVRTKTAFPTGLAFRDAVTKCVPQVPDQASAVFDVEMEDGVLRTSDFAFEGFGNIDAHTRNCLESALAKKVTLGADDAIDKLPRFRLTISKGGSTYSTGSSPRP